MSAMGGCFLKLGAQDIEFSGGTLQALMSILTNIKILSGVFLYFIPVLIWIFLLKKVELSFLQPLFSLMYVITPIFAIFFLDEHVSTLRWLGIGVVGIGVLIISRT